MLKLTTKSQIEIHLLELKYSDATHRSFNTQSILAQDSVLMPGLTLAQR